MARSSSDKSILHSTSVLFSYLDLNNEQHQQQEMQNMDEIDIDQIVDVPDTPDRSPRINSRECHAKEYNLSGMGNSVSSDLLDDRAPTRPRSQFRSTIIPGNNGSLRRSHSRWGNPSSRDEMDQNNHTFVSLSDSPSSSSRFSGRMMEQPVFKEPGTVLPQLPRGHRGSSDVAKFGRDTPAIAEVLASDPKYQDNKMKRSMPRNNRSRDTGKNTYAEIPSISITCEDDNNVMDSTVRSEYTGVAGRARSHGAHKDIPSKEFKKGSLGSSSRGTSNSSKPSDNAYEWKTNTEDDTYMPSHAALNHGKGIDLSLDSKPKVAQIASNRNTGQKWLVRGGCISPNNIAKHTSESQVHSSQGGQDDIKVISNGGIQSNEVRSIASNSEASQSIRMDKGKGKGVMFDPRQAKEYDAKATHLPGRSIGIRDAGEDNVSCSKQKDGWRSTRSRPRITSSELSGEVEHFSRRNSGGGHLLDQSQGSRNGNGNYSSGTATGPQNGILGVSDHVSFQQVPGHSVQASSSSTSELSPENGRHGRVNKINKRQRKHSSARSNLGECCTLDFDDSEITYLCSSGEPAIARSTRSRDPHSRGISGPIIEIDESSPEIRCRKPEGTSEIVNDDSEERSRQMEADEILARQLQEQFYTELPGVGGGENDASVAWRLQQQEDSQRLSLGNRRISHHDHRDSSMSHLYRHYPSDSLPSPSFQSAANRARGSLYTRTQRLRNSFRRPPTLPSSRGRQSRFPPNMDIDTRIHILEALEAAVNDEDMTSHFFHVQRDFNENDYEMLLALDENNHQHVGATRNQINGLPQSTVQSENFEEACAICLETPTIGDTIRHLPCLHKFHKDCIDQWLGRSTSCPVCKSGIN